MTRLAPSALLLAGAALCSAAAAAPAWAAPASTVEITARDGRQAAVAKALGQGAVRVERRRGRTFQATMSPARARALRRVPGVAQVTTAAVGFGDEGPVVSQGLRRTGAAALAAEGASGSGLVIAVLDLGFGRGIGALQDAGELPSAANVEYASFDAANGLEGRNAYGNATNHGELVAQTVFDYAPKARYLFVNYRTDQDFLAAVDWLVARRPDIVVHSNSFIEGPFDGTSPGAQAVDRAAAAGILWFNSAGNYQRRMWSGAWADREGDGVQDFPDPGNGVFYRGAGSPITFAVTWRSPEGAVTDLDLVLERRADDGSAWTPVVASADRQTVGGWASERFTGYSPPADGFFRVRIVRASGPPPAGQMTLVSREIDMSLFGGATSSTIPTPGDAAGAVAVGAVDWRGDRLQEYSSIGPTDDGRMKPDLVAPTDTALAGPNGPRGVGGTSNAAPNAAGAAALLIERRRAQGLPTAPADIRAVLAGDAYDLGAPGPDMEFGAGRVRVDLTGPALTVTRPRPLSPMRRTVAVSAASVDPSGTVRLTLGIGTRVLARAQVRDGIGARFDSRSLRDGRHALWVEGADWAGNVATIRRVVRIDNTAPRVQLLRIARAKRPKAASARPARLWLRVRDGGGGRQRVVLDVGGHRVRTAVPAGRIRVVRVGRLQAGRVSVRAQVTDVAGNVRQVRRTLRAR